MYQRAFACAQLAVDYIGSEVVDVSAVADVGVQQGAHSCFAACVLLCNFVAALQEAPLLYACCYGAALPGLAPFTPGGPTGQRPSPLLMLKLCSCHYPQSLVGRYPRSSGSSVMLWTTPGNPGTHGIEQGRKHLSVRDAR